MSVAALAAGLGFGASFETAAAALDPKASRLYEDALGRFERRDLPGAIVQLKNALQIDRSQLPVQVLLGRALLGNGEAAAAEVALLEALRLGVNRAEVVLPLAQCFIAQGKQQPLLEQAQFALNGLPPALRLQLGLVRAAARSDLGDTRGALGDIEEARAIDPNALDSWLAEVPVRVRARQPREAAAAAERAVALAPNAAEAHYQRATVLHVGGDLDAALVSYSRAIALAPKHVEARVARAGLYVDLGRNAEAAQEVAVLKRDAPGEPRGAYLEALLAERAGDAKAARAALQRVTALIDPAPLPVIRYRSQLMILNGLAHFSLGEPEKAKPYLESYQRLQGNGAVSKLLAQIYLSEANVPRAIDLLDAHVKAYPGDGQALTLLASAHMSQGRHARATALMQDALRTRDRPEFRTALGLSLAGAGQRGDAAAQFELALKKDPAQLQAAASLAAIALRRGDSSRAVQLAEGLVQRQPGNAGFHNLLGMARAAAGDSAGARAAFTQSLKLEDLLPVRLNLVRMDTNARSFDAAAAELAVLVKAHERSDDVLFESAVLADRRGQPADAQRWLEKARDHEAPRQTRAGLALVDLHLRQGNAPAAVDAAKRVASKAPEDVPVLLAYSRAQLAAADATGARSNLGTATRLAQFDAPVQTEIAALQLAARNVEGAAYSLDKALGSQPDFVAALALRADVDLRQNEPAKAEQRARRIVALAPKLALGHGVLGDVALARGQAGPALDAFRRAHEAEPSSLTVLRLFRLQWPRDGGRTSLALADQWVKAHPGDLEVRRAAADGYARAGNAALAQNRYEAMLALAPGDTATLNNLANVLLRRNDPAALAMAERAVAASPADANAIDTLGWVLFRQGQADRSLQLLRDARLRDPANPDIRYHLAAVLAHSGRHTSAQDELQAALKMGGFESRADAQALLISLR